MGEPSQPAVPMRSRSVRCAPPARPCPRARQAWSGTAPPSRQPRQAAGPAEHSGVPKARVLAGRPERTLPKPRPSNPPLRARHPLRSRPPSTPPARRGTTPARCRAVHGALRGKPIAFGPPTSGATYTTSLASDSPSWSMSCNRLGTAEGRCGASALRARGRLNLRPQDHPRHNRLLCRPQD